MVVVAPIPAYDRGRRPAADGGSTSSRHLFREAAETSEAAKDALRFANTWDDSIASSPHISKMIGAMKEHLAPTAAASEPAEGTSDASRLTYEGPGFSDNALLPLYLDSAGNVAFIDESYLEPSRAIGGGNTIYVVSAVLVPRARIRATRDKLVELTATGHWHTTERFRDVDGKEDILRMARYIARASATVVAVKAPLDTRDKGGEAARRACFEALVDRLLGGKLLDSNGLLVYEQRRDAAQRKADHATFRRLRSDGKIPDSFFVYEGSPGTEPLLWAPDVMAWATRRSIALDDHQWLAPVKARDRYRRVDVS